MRAFLSRFPRRYRSFFIRLDFNVNRWGFYTLRGRTAKNALSHTAQNFICALLPALLILPFAFSQLRISARGAFLAVLSGAFASGVGYTIWYAVLKFHTATRAAILQLSVPILAAIGGVFILFGTDFLQTFSIKPSDYRRNRFCGD